MAAARRLRSGRRPKSRHGWTLPADADEEKNPLPATRKRSRPARCVFKNKCQQCHGPGGKGDGPDADPDAMEDMDLTNAKRAERNPDGVVFYKVWNGREKPKMPAPRTSSRRIRSGSRRVRADAAQEVEGETEPPSQESA